jgi:hypothetical protein
MILEILMDYKLYKLIRKVWNQKYETSRNISNKENKCIENRTELIVGKRMQWHKKSQGLLL